MRRLEATYRALDCGAGNFFGDAPQCAGVASQLRAAQAVYGTLMREAEGQIGVEQRRRRLERAAERACAEPAPERAAQRAPEPRGEVKGEVRRPGGGRLVCVRACDGFFFPLQNLPERGEADDMCKALCPGAEAAAYSMPVDGDISQAVSQRGQPYTKLPNALRYTQAVDRSCSCRKPGQSWTEALARAERMLARNRDDVVVTAAKAEELSRPKLLRPKVERGRREIAARPQEAFTASTTGSVSSGAAEGADARAAARAGESAPTASRESSGIGETPQGPRLVQQGEGGTRSAAGRPVRVIAPDVVAVPRTQ
jgi:hypothetical protein